MGAAWRAAALLCVYAGAVLAGAEACGRWAWWERASTVAGAGLMALWVVCVLVWAAVTYVAELWGGAFDEGRAEGREHGDGGDRRGGAVREGARGEGLREVRRVDGPGGGQEEGREPGA